MEQLPSTAAISVAAITAAILSFYDLENATHSE